MVSAEKIAARSNQEKNTALQKLLNLFPAGDKNPLSATEAPCFDSSSQDIHDPARTNYCDFLSPTCRRHTNSLLDRFRPVPGGSVGGFTADIDPPRWRLVIFLVKVLLLFCLFMTNIRQISFFSV